MNVYFIFCLNDNQIPFIINMTTDYYYFRRLMKKYISNGKHYYYKTIDIYSLITNSIFTR